ncbi:MAG TPA: molybdenum cofactor biosynthesis protein B [Candidatus Bathyarchaeia archaeon]|nr:molybdenum cofactor biosynthesis protein B [Candidatus Bathyarchaeia archaeon]
MSKVAELHKHDAPASLGIYILTCSTSKFKELKTGQHPEDTSGDIIEKLSSTSGHRVEGRRLVSDSRPMIRRIAKKALSSKAVDILIITGGTGLSPRDVTVESISRLVDKKIPGFGELFRNISFNEIGSAAMLSRAFAGSANGKIIFCLPGSPDGVQTAMERLILPEIGHMIKISREPKQPSSSR